MKKRFIGILLCVGMVVSMLTGCSSEKEPDTSVEGIQEENDIQEDNIVEENENAELDENLGNTWVEDVLGESELERAYEAYQEIDNSMRLIVFKLKGSEIPFVLQKTGNLYHYEDGELVRVFGENYIFETVYVDTSGEYVYLDIVGNSWSYWNICYAKVGSDGKLELIEEYRGTGEYASAFIFYDSSGNKYTADEMSDIRDNYDFEITPNATYCDDYAYIENAKEKYFEVND